MNKKERNLYSNHTNIIYTDTMTACSRVMENDTDVMTNSIRVMTSLRRVMTFDRCVMTSLSRVMTFDRCVMTFYRHVMTSLRRVMTNDSQTRKNGFFTLMGISHALPFCRSPSMHRTLKNIMSITCLYQVIFLNNKKLNKMTSRNESKLNMYRTVKQLCDDNTAIITPNAAFVVSFTNFKTRLSALITNVTSESAVISGIAVDKKVAKRNLSQNAADIAGIVYAYASATNNNTLKDAVDFPLSTLQRMKDDMLAPNCQNIYTAANANATAIAPYGISAAMIASLQTSINDYSNSVPKPRTAKAIKETYTANIKALIKEIDVILNEQMDRTMVSFKPTKPDFVSSYKHARSIIDPSSTTTQLYGKVTDKDDTLALKKVAVTLSGETNTTVFTSKAGIFRFKPVTQGEYTLSIIFEGYASVTIENLKVKLGQVNRQNVALSSI